MTLSVMDTARAMPAIRGVPQVYCARVDEGAGVSARDLEALLGTLNVEPRQMAPFLVSARNRAGMDPESIVGAQSFRAMYVEAVRRCLPDAASAFETLASLAQSGELDEILAGDRTPSVVRASARMLRRYGKADFDINDPVLHKSNPERGRGVVVDFTDDTKGVIVQWNSLETSEESPGDLTRCATAAPVQPTPEDDFTSWLGGALASRMRSPMPRAAAHTRTPADVVRSKLAACGLIMPPEITTMSYVDDPNPHDPYGAMTGHARVLVRAHSHSGANLELEVPVPYQGNEYGEPEVFVFGSSTYQLTPKSVANLLAHFGSEPLPHNVAPFQSGEYQIMSIPTPPKAGVFAAPLDLPARYPGF